MIGRASSGMVATLAVGAALAIAAVVVMTAVPREDADEGGVLADCHRRESDATSVAQVWDEALLASIRRDIPAPTVHARNLFHTSAAMWDAWAAFDPVAQGYLVTEKRTAGDVRAARETAISFAAFRILLHRYSLAAGMEETFAHLAVTMASLCYDASYASAEGESPAAFGNRIAAAYIALGREDGSQEAVRYADPSYSPANPPLVVASGEITMRDPNRWQPLALTQIVAQNGLPIPGGVQRFIGSQWGSVGAFALPASADGLPVDPGPPPQWGGETDQEYREQAVEVIRLSQQLDATDGATIDISPGALGDNSLGTNDGDGRESNPVTGEPYAPNVVARGDFARVLTEFWADGPESETPPGHWNTIANEVSRHPGLERRIGGTGPVVDALEWDVKLYLALNGAVHDAAVAAWGVKRHYDSVRPISMVRYLGSLGQSSDPGAPSYDPRGLPLEPGLIELVTEESSVAGERHEHLAEHVGELAVRAWRRTGPDISGVGWVRAIDWTPYQKPTFISPAFAGYVSGHSTFSRAAAEVMTAFTGSPFFPDGLSEWTVHVGELGNEHGPSDDVTLQWATFYDAADQAGLSRLFGGIHIAADDFGGRRMGSQCGLDAMALASRYFAGTA